MTASTIRFPWALGPAGIVLLLGLPSLLYPFGFDQSNHAFIAWRCLSGERLYTDVFSLKPPLTTLAHALSQLVFGHHMAAVRLWDLAWVMAEATLLGTLLGRLLPHTRRWQAFAVATLYALGYYALSFWHTAQTDGWTSLLVTASLVLAAGSPWARGRHWTLLAAGLCIGAASGFKYTMAPALVVPLLYVLTETGRSYRARVGDAALVVGGFAACCALTLAVLASIGSLEGFLHSHLSTVFSYAGRGIGEETRDAPVSLVRAILRRLGAFQSMGRVLYSVPMSWTLLLTLAAVAPVLAWRRGPSVMRVMLILLTWWVCACLSTVVQGRFFLYHYAPLIAPTAMMAVLSLDMLGRHLTGRASRSVVLVAAAVAFLGVSEHGKWRGFTSPIREYRQLASEVASGFEITSHWSSPAYRLVDSFRIDDNLSLAVSVRSLARPGDRMFVWGTSTAVSYLTEVPPPTSVYTSAQVTEFIGRQVSRSAWLEELRADLPRFFVIQSGDAIPHVLPDFLGSDRELDRFGELGSLLQAHYRPVERRGSLKLLMRLGGDQDH